MGKNPKNIRSKKVVFRDNIQTSTNDDYPSFCFNKLDKKFNIEACTKEDRAIIAKRLAILGNLKWAELQSSPRHANGHEIIKRGSIKTTTDSIPSEKNIIAFRLGGGKSKVIMGYRDFKDFYIIWIDTKGLLYQH